MSAFSAGGGAAIAFAEEDGIGAMWLDSAVLDFTLLVKNELGRLGYPEFFAGPAVMVGGWLVGVELDARSPMEAAKNAGDRPVFLTHGIEDPRVSIVHSENFEEMSYISRKRAIDKFDLQIWLGKHEKIFSQLIQGNKF